MDESTEWIDEGEWIPVWAQRMKGRITYRSVAIFIHCLEIDHRNPCARENVEQQEVQKLRNMEGRREKGEKKEMNPLKEEDILSFIPNHQHRKTEKNKKRKKEMIGRTLRTLTASLFTAAQKPSIENTIVVSPCRIAITPRPEKG